MSGLLAAAAGLVVQARAVTFTLGRTNAVVGPAAGCDSVVLVSSATNAGWTAMANAAWLHLNSTNQSGTGGTNVIFTFDANASATRSGTLTIATQTLTVTQAGATYVATPGTPVPLVPAILNQPTTVVVDAATNLFIADAGQNAIKKWSTTAKTLTTVVSNGLNVPTGVAVDSAGNLYIADTFNNAVKKWSASNQTVTTLIGAGLNLPQCLAVDSNGDVFIGDYDGVKKWTPASNTNQLIYQSSSFAILGLALDGATNIYFCGNDSLYKLPLGSQSPALLASDLDSPHGLASDAVGNIYIADTDGLDIREWKTNGTEVSISTNSGLYGPQGVARDAAGNLYIADTGNGRIMELPTGSTNLQTVVQSQLFLPLGVTVDSASNVYIADFNDQAIKKWLAASNSVVTLASTNFGYVTGIALDASSNVYFSDTYGNAIDKWSVANSNVTTVIPASAGLNTPTHVAMDPAGNLFIADYGNSAIRKWVPATSSLTTIVSSPAVNFPIAVATDAAGNVYFTDGNSAMVKEWLAASSNVISLFQTPDTVIPSGMAVDGAGDVYYSDQFDFGIFVWHAADLSITGLGSGGLNLPYGVAVDGSQNIYTADSQNNQVQELPRAFVDATVKVENFAAGTDSLLAVLPATENLRAPFAPTSDSAWLTVTGVTNGVVSYAFTANTGANRTGHITVLGEAVTVTQSSLADGIRATLVSGNLQLTFSNAPSATYTILTSTNLLAARTTWTVAGTASNIAPGVYQFATPVTNGPKRFFCVRSP